MMRQKKPWAPAKKYPLDQARVGIVASRFNPQIVQQLLTGCYTTLNENGITDDRIVLARVPGAFEIPVAVNLLLRHDQLDAVITLGAIIKGDTPHFHFIATECARGIATIALQNEVAVIFGVLTVDTVAQAQARCSNEQNNKGVESAYAAIEMIQLTRHIKATHTGG